MKRFAKRIIPPKIYHYLGSLKQEIRAFCVGYDPKKCMSMFYKDVFHKEMNWDNPKNLIEKINWLQLNTDTSLWTTCADKYAVREYIKNKGLSDVLNILYGVWDKVEDINWEKLPNQFVLKTTQGCGEVIIVKDKSKLDIKGTEKKLKKWMKEKYGRVNGQTHYTRIHPKIVAEKLLLNTEDFSKSLVDYKIWCFNGEPEFILVVYDRIIGGQYLCSSYSPKWEDISKEVLNKKSKHYFGRLIKKPENLDKMLEIAKILSADFKEVRVDLYNIKGNIIFGELTFTTGFGYLTEDYYNYLGSKIDLKDK